MRLRVIARDGGPLTSDMIIARNLMRELELFLPLSMLIAPEVFFPNPVGWAALPGLLWVFVFALMQFLFAPVIGNLSDRFGRRPVLLVSLAALGIDYVIMGLAPSLGLGRRIVDLVSTGATLAANDLVEVERIAEVSSRLIVNRAALKTRATEVTGWIDRFRDAAQDARDVA